MNAHEKISTPQGFISAYLHTGEGVEFVQLSEDPMHGYFRIPKKSILFERHTKNLIVTKASQFMAKRMRPGTNWGNGITHLELGSGVGTGTLQNPQPETIAQTNLREPFVRKPITSWTYLDSNKQPTASETNVIQLSTLFTEEEANGSIVEMGLFGGDATDTIGTGYMFNYKVFPVITKGNTMQLTIIWTLTF